MTQQSLQKQNSENQLSEILTVQINTTITASQKNTFPQETKCSDRMAPSQSFHLHSLYIYTEQSAGRTDHSIIQIEL